MKLILITSSLFIIMMVIAISRRVEIIEGMRGRRGRSSATTRAQGGAGAAGLTKEIAQKIADNYYTKGQTDEKIDKLEQTIRLIAKNADKYFQKIAKDLYQ